MEQGKLEVKLKLLKLTCGKTKAVIENGNVDKIRRQKELIEGVVKAVELLKLGFEEAQLEKGKSVEEIQEWGQEIEAQIALADEEMEILSKRLKDIANHEENERLEMRAKFNDVKENATKLANEKPRVKLPKLQITAFDGKLENWLGFWNKFEAEVDTINMPTVTKFAYLKEMVEPKVLFAIDGLPFSTEGYERAKNILKTTYGKTSEIINAYVSNIQALPVIHGTHAGKINQFYKSLSFNVQSLETLGKTNECWALVRGALDKLPGIKADLVRGKSDWQSWGFPQLLSALREWTEIHPETFALAPKPTVEYKTSRPQKSFFQTQENKAATCVYCDNVSHKSAECPKLKTSDERKTFLRDQKRCFNCTGSKHVAAKCKSRSNCAKCQGRHHTSICDKNQQSPPPAEPGMTAVSDKVCHPVVIVKVNGVKCRALLDTGSTSTYMFIIPC